MIESDKRIMELRDELKRVMLELLDLAPGIGWHYISEAEHQALRTQSEGVSPDQKAS
jgi:hypothetical protein